MKTNKRPIISDEELAAFLDGNAGIDSVNILKDAMVDPETAEILSLSPKIDFLASRSICDMLPMGALAAANTQKLCSFECESAILRRHGIDADHWSLLETAKANNWLREDGTPLHHVGRLLELKGMYVSRRYDATFADLVEALDKGYDVMAVTGTDDKNFHALLIAGIDSENIACSNPVSGSVNTVPLNSFADGWEKSGRYMVTASVDSGEYTPRPIDVENIDLDPALTDLTEAIAENAHDIWAAERMREGWTYGPERDDHRLTNPDLVPYARLPESEKDYDRMMAINTIKLVHRLGFDIIPH